MRDVSWAHRSVGMYWVSSNRKYNDGDSGYWDVKWLSPKRLLEGGSPEAGQIFGDAKKLRSFPFSQYHHWPFWIFPLLPHGCRIAATAPNIMSCIAAFKLRRGSTVRQKKYFTNVVPPLVAFPSYLNSHIWVTYLLPKQCLEKGDVVPGLSRFLGWEASQLWACCCRTNQGFSERRKEGWAAGQAATDVCHFLISACD